MNRKLTVADEDAIAWDFAKRITKPIKVLCGRFGGVDRATLYRAAKRSRSRQTQHNTVLEHIAPT